MKTVDLAKDIVYLCRKNNIEYSNTKVQKLLYIFIGYSLATKVFYDIDINEMPIALPNGPAFKKVLDGYHTNIEPLDASYKLIHSGQALELMETVVKEWGNYNAKTLSDWSHEQSSPWFYITQIRRQPLGANIDYWAIKHYFEELNKIKPIYVAE
jgi:uncharacterized phage-associated protein